MKKNKQKWEKMYEEYMSSTNGIDDKIESRKQALQESNLDLVKDIKFESLKDAYRDLKKLEKIKANLEKVKNVIELKEKIQLDKEKIEQEIAARKEQFELTKDIQKLELEMQVLEQEYDNLKNKEKSPDLSDTEKKEIRKSIEENMNKRSENNKKFSEIYQKRENLSLNDQYKNKTNEELKEEALNLSINISICNSAGRALIKGMNINNMKDMLNLKFSGKILKAKGKEKEKVDEYKKVKDSKIKEQEQEPEQETEPQPEQEQEQETEPQPEQEPEQEQKLKKVSEFDLKHPRLAKIKNFFANIIQRVQGNKKIQEQPKTEEPSKDIDIDIDSALEMDNARTEFIKYLTEYAEKGEEGIKKEKREQAKIKLEENREAAKKRESKKAEER